MFSNHKGSCAREGYDIYKMFFGRFGSNQQAQPGHALRCEQHGDDGGPFRNLKGSEANTALLFLGRSRKAKA